MKEFGIEHCKCNRIPHVNKQQVGSEYKYSIKCCDWSVEADTETYCIVLWNKTINKIKEEQNNESCGTESRTGKA